MKISSQSLLILLASILLSSCLSSKKVVYFQDAKPKEGEIKVDSKSDSSRSINNTVRIQPFDVLDIRVKINNPKQGLDNPFLSNAGSAGSGFSGQNTNGIPTAYYSGFLVDAEGNVYLPLLGNVNLKNLTLEEARELIISKSKEFLHDPYVEIKFLTFKVTIMGEVQRPGIINIPNEKANILDALSLAGDLSDFANSKRIKIIRGELDKNPDVYLIDLTSISTLKSAGYNLKPNDLVYVEPLPRKFFLANTTTILTFVSVLNILTILAINFLR